MVHGFRFILCFSRLQHNNKPPTGYPVATFVSGLAMRQPWCYKLLIGPVTEGEVPTTARTVNLEVHARAIGSRGN